MSKEKIEKAKTRFEETSKIKENNRGITLVALVITIIIIIILAVVAISYAFGDNGLIRRAEQAGEFYANDTAYTDGSIANVESYINDILDGTGNEGTQIPTPPGGSLTDDSVPIPAGFYYVGGTKNDGVVISDNPADANQGAEHDKVAGMQGNQFVWVPVENPSDYFIEETIKLNGVETTTDVYSKLRIRVGDYYTSAKPGDTSSLREPDVLSSYDTDAQYYQKILGYGSIKEMADSFVEEYTEMYESIKKYGGFYIGRYELTGTVDGPTVKAGTVMVLKNWYDLRKACTEIIKNNENVTSSMIYGVEWDETMNWLKNTTFAGNSGKVDYDSSSWGNYYIALGGSGKSQPTGSNEKWSANHIYDLAGNHYEWTQEAYGTDKRVFRGGSYDMPLVVGSIIPASDRDNNLPATITVTFQLVQF